MPARIGVCVTREPRVFQPCVRGRMWLIAANLGYVIRDGRKCLDCVQPSPTASRLISFARPSFPLPFPSLLSFFLSSSFISKFAQRFSFTGRPLLRMDTGIIFRPIIPEDGGQRTVVTKDRSGVGSANVRSERASETACCGYLSTYKAARWNLHIILMQFAIRIATAESLGCELYSVCGGWMDRFN